MITSTSRKIPLQHRILTVLLFLLVTAPSNAGDLLPITWGTTKIGDLGTHFSSDELCPANSTVKVKIVEWRGKSEFLLISGALHDKITPGSVNTERLGYGLDGKGEKLTIGVGSLSSFETPISSTKLDSGAWLLKFSECSVEVKLLGPDL